MLKATFTESFILVSLFEQFYDFLSLIPRTIKSKLGSIGAGSIAVGGFPPIKFKNSQKNYVTSVSFYI